MRKSLAAAAVVIALVLAGCGSITYTPPGAAPTPSVTASEDAATQAPTLDKDQFFLQSVRQAHPALNGVPDATILNVATSTCTALDNGATALDIASRVASASNGDAATMETLGYVVGAGIAVYCPQYGYLFKTDGSGV